VPLAPAAVVLGLLGLVRGSAPGPAVVGFALGLLEVLLLLALLAILSAAY
jgi:hypothetical protein